MITRFNIKEGGFIKLSNKNHFNISVNLFKKVDKTDEETSEKKEIEDMTSGELMELWTKIEA